MNVNRVNDKTRINVPRNNGKRLLAMIAQSRGDRG